MKLSTKIILGSALVITLSALNSYTNYLLSEKVIINTHFLSNSEAIIRNSSRLQNKILEMQSAFRGFLLTEDESFLEPYHDGLKEVPPIISLQHALVTNTSQEQKIDSILSLHNQWISYSNELINAKKESIVSPSKKAGYQNLFNRTLRRNVGKNLNEFIKVKFREFNLIEYRIRQSRREMLQTSIKQTRLYSLILVLLSLLISIIGTIYIVRSITRRIEFMVRLAERIARGDFYQVSDSYRDELSSLSSSLNIMSDNLKNNIKQLENRNTELNQFASVVSHDLKAPLRGIHNVVSWIEEDLGNSLTAELRNYLDIIPERIARMENLINGLLEYARISRDKPLKETVNLQESVELIINSIVPRGFDVIVKDLPVISTQKIRIEQVFSNLISNAVKYSKNDRGKIQITCKEYPNFYAFRVDDNGIGIDPQYHEKIFVIFQTLREQNSAESTGIGLSIVKKILEEQNSTVKVESTLGNGSAFIFNWPKH
ncbi:MAG: ATP-binding protein [Daejeonella sp.]